jgi:hypothetical protein
MDVLDTVVNAMVVTLVGLVLAWLGKGQFDAFARRFEAVNERFDAVDQRFDAVDQRFDAVDQRFDRLEERLGHASMGFRRRSMPCAPT